MVISCPDLQSVCGAVAADRLLEPLYIAPAGPIAPLDVLYGLRSAIARENTFMAHRCGFTLRVLAKELRRAGFRSLWGRRYPAQYALTVIAAKQQLSQDALAALAKSHFGAPSPGGNAVLSGAAEDKH